MGRNREPVGHTCPDINNLQSRFEQIKSHVQDIEYEAKCSISELEELRRANDSLRNWGSEEADRVDELEDEVFNLQQENKDLKEEIEYLQRQLQELEQKHKVA